MKLARCAFKCLHYLVARQKVLILRVVRYSMQHGSDIFGPDTWTSLLFFVHSPVFFSVFYLMNLTITL